MKKPKRIFSGDYSRDMWKEINSAKTVRDLRYALYGVCCRLQELESKLEKQRKLDGEYSDILSRRHGIRKLSGNPH